MQKKDNIEQLLIEQIKNEEKIRKINEKLDNQSFYDTQQINLKKLLLSKHNLCPHQKGCIPHTILGFLKAFSLMFGMKCAILALLLILKVFVKKNPANKTFGSKFMQYVTLYLSQTFNLQNFQVPLFMGLYAMTLKITNCSMRRIRNKDDWKNAYLAGFLAGLTIATQKQQSYRTWRIYLASRSLEMIYNSMVNRQIIKHRLFHYTLMYMVGSFLISYSYFNEQMIASKDVPKLYDYFANLDLNEKTYHYCNVLATEKRLIERFPKLKDSVSKYYSLYD